MWFTSGRALDRGKSILKKGLEHTLGESTHPGTGRLSGDKVCKSEHYLTILWPQARIFPQRVTSLTALPDPSPLTGVTSRYRGKRSLSSFTWLMTPTILSLSWSLSRAVMTASSFSSSRVPKPSSRKKNPRGYCLRSCILDERASARESELRPSVLRRKIRNHASPLPLQVVDPLQSTLWHTASQLRCLYS